VPRRPGLNAFKRNRQRWDTFRGHPETPGRQSEKKQKGRTAWRGTTSSVCWQSRPDHRMWKRTRGAKGGSYVRFKKERFKPSLGVITKKGNGNARRDETPDTTSTFRSFRGGEVYYSLWTNSKRAISEGRANFGTTHDRNQNVSSGSTGWLTKKAA